MAPKAQQQGALLAWLPQLALGAAQIVLLPALILLLMQQPVAAPTGQGLVRLQAQLPQLSPPVLLQDPETKQRLVHRVGSPQGQLPVQPLALVLEAGLVALAPVLILPLLLQQELEAAPAEQRLVHLVDSLQAQLPAQPLPLVVGAALTAQLRVLVLQDPEAAPAEQGLAHQVDHLQAQLLSPLLGAALTR